MKKYLVLFAVSICFLSCKNEETKNNSDKIQIVTTTQMIADVVRNIAGDKAEVISLMGPGIDPHFYKATQGDLQKLNNADIIFYNGLHLEGKMQDVFERYAKKKMVVAVSKDIPKEKLIISSSQGEETIYDPHIWHSLEHWRYVLKPIEMALNDFDVKNNNFYEVNAKNFAGSLQNLNNEIQVQISTIPKEQRLLITSHDAFNYFGKTYDIEVKGLQGISTVSEIGIKDITEMVDLIIKRKVKAVFVESSVNEKNLKAVIEGCKNKGWEVKIGGTLFSDAMGADDKPEGTYIGMIKYNTESIVAALK